MRTYEQCSSESPPRPYRNYAYSSQCGPVSDVQHRELDLTRSHVQPSFAPPSMTKQANAIFQQVSCHRCMGTGQGRRICCLDFFDHTCDECAGSGSVLRITSIPQY